MTLRRVLRLVAVLALACPGTHAAAATVEGVRVWSGPESTRVVLDLDAPADHRLFTLSDPERIVVDLPGTSLRAPLRLYEPKGAVAGLRTGEQERGTLRVVLDLRQAVRPKSFALPPNAQYGHRLVIDLMPAGHETVVKRAPRPEATDGGRDLVIAIDAGHGGDDPGASGRQGVREKDVVLAIARRLSEEVQREPGMRPVMIRNGDYFVSLDQRRAIARRAEADLFVSIHADSYRDASAKGATVYVLSQKGATDEQARRLAERENASDLIGGVSLADKDQVLARVLLDLSQGAALSASLAAGERVIASMRTVTAMRKTDVQQAAFFVLKSPDIPSIFIETAYISNPKEESELRDSGYQAGLARAISDGIVAYFAANPPPGSYLALHPQGPRVPGRHVITRGETLSGIAERYRVSVRSLKTFNGLRGDVIRVGQVLTIPPG